MQKGVRSGFQREEPVDVTYREAIAICEALPEYTVRGGRGIVPGRPLPPKAFVVRDRVRFAFEMALRPGDAGKIEMGRHWNRGQAFLTITPDIDKVGFSGRLTLTRTALAILEKHAPERGPIFGKHDLRDLIKRAALKVLPEDKAKKFAAYDFRHGRAVDALEKTNDLLGTSRLLRHLQLTTTNRYLRTREAHVESVVETLDSVRTASGETDQGSNTTDVSEVDMSNDSVNLVRRRGLEPLRCYPLAPQRPETEEFREFPGADKRQTASKNDGETGSGDTAPSADGQQYLSAARRKLAFEATLWDVFDEFSLRNLEEVDE